MQYLGELISIGVAFSWTATALLSEMGSKRMGNVTLNFTRMAITLIFSAILFWIVTGSPLPAHAQCYIIIGSKFGQLFMTLAPITAAIMAWVTLGQSIKPMGIVAMLVTLTGIAITVLGRGDSSHRLSLKLPLNGVLFAIGAAVCQGVGLVLSKIGMNHYEASMTTPCEPWILPFYANVFRCLAGITGFFLLLMFKEGFQSLRKNITDRTSMTVATLTTIFGPFVGVGCSLLAVQYTSAASSCRHGGSSSNPLPPAAC